MNKSFAFDKRFLIWIAAIGSCLLVIATLSEGDNKVMLTTICFIILCGLYSLMEPNYYVTDKDGIAIYYFVFIKYYYKWNEIKSIHEGVAGNYKDHYKAYFLITSNQKKKPFFMTDAITKSSATKRLIKMYWNGEIIGDEDINYEKALKREKRKLLISNEKYLIKTEGQIRAELDNIVREYKTKAKHHGKFIKTKYSYEADNKLLKERPACSYSFLVSIKVETAGKSENESAFNIIKLLAVNRNKNKNKITKNKNAASEIRNFLTESIEK